MRDLMIHRAVEGFCVGVRASHWKAHIVVGRIVEGFISSILNIDAEFFDDLLHDIDGLPLGWPAVGGFESFNVLCVENAVFR